MTITCMMTHTQACSIICVLAWLSHRASLFCSTFTFFLIWQLPSPELSGTVDSFICLSDSRFTVPFFNQDSIRSWLWDAGFGLLENDKTFSNIYCIILWITAHDLLCVLSNRKKFNLLPTETCTTWYNSTDVEYQYFHNEWKSTSSECTVQNLGGVRGRRRREKKKGQMDNYSLQEKPLHGVKNPPDITS